MIEEAQEKVFSKPNSKVRVVVMMTRENEAKLHQLGAGRPSRGMDVIFETLRMYEEKERKNGKKK